MERSILSLSRVRRALQASLTLICAGLIAAPGETYCFATLDLSELESAEFDQAFMAAACACDLMVMGSERLTFDEASLAEDSFLASYAQRRDGFGGDYCASLQQTPHGVRLSTLPPRTNVACDRPVNAATYLAPGTHANVARHFAPGSCRAEMNYCLANELGLAADSLATPPSSALVRTRLLREARARMASSALENVQTFDWLTATCSEYFPGHTFPSSDDGSQDFRYKLACTSFRDTTSQTSLGMHVARRIVDGIDSLQRWSEEEIAIRRTLADAIPSPSALGSVTEWNEEQWGAESERMKAAQVVYGDGSPALRVYSRALSDGGYDTTANSWDWEIPVSRPSSAFGRRAAELLEAGVVGFGMREPPGGTWFADYTPFDFSRWRANQQTNTQTGTFDGSTAIHRYLDHRLAAIRRVGPYRNPTGYYLTFRDEVRSNVSTPEVSFWWAVTHPLAAADSQLAREGVRAEHVGEALATRADVFATMSPSMNDWQRWGNWSPAHGSFRASDLSTSLVSRSIPLATVKNRDVSVLANALSRGSWRTPTADLTFPSLTASRPTTNGGPASSTLASTREFDLSFQQRWDEDPDTASDDATLAAIPYTLDDRGVAGTFFAIQRHLRFLTHYAASTAPYAAQVARPLPILQSALDAIDRAIGTTSGRFEHATDRYRFTYPLPASGAPDPFARATFFFTTSLRDAQCFEHAGNAGIVNSAVCGNNPRTILSRTVSDNAAMGTRSIEVQLSEAYIVPGPTSERTNRPLVYLLLARMPGTYAPELGAPYQAETIEHVDTFDWNPEVSRANVAVHPLGGDLELQVLQTFEREPLDPARPVRNSLGLKTDLVPPLESGLAQDGDGTEDSLRHYLDQMQTYVTSASTRLADARAAELQAVWQDRADSASLSLAALGYSSRVADLCGGDATQEHPCVTPTRPTTSAFDLGIGIPPPSGWPATEPERTSLVGQCETMMRDLASTLPPLDTDVDAFKTRIDQALYCMHLLTYDEIRKISLNGFPTAVYDELRAGGVGEYRQAAGVVRDVHVQIHDVVESARDSAAAFESARSAASRTIQSSSTYVGSLEDDAQRGRIVCILGVTTQLLRTAETIANSSKAVYEGKQAASASAQYRSDIEGLNEDLSALYDKYDVSGSYAKLPKVTSADEDKSDLASSVVSSTAGLFELAGTSCQISDDTIREKKLTLVLTVFRALAQMSAQRAAILESFGNVALLGDAYRLVSAQADDARATYRRTTMMIGTDNLADLPAFRVAQSASAIDAREAFRHAQQFAFVARRSVESTFGEDLERSIGVEPFVEPPADWINSLYGFAYVTTGTPPISSGSEELTDWAIRLRSYVAGYGVQRRFRDASDFAVLDLAAIDDRTAEGRPFHSTLTYKCSAHDEPLLGGTLTGAPTSEPCAGLGDVEWASLEFSIATRDDTYTGNVLARRSFNYRNDGIALNLVGSGIVDCSRATRPAECELDGNLQYDLRQAELGWVENFAGDTLGFDYGPGVILDARALAVSRVLTNPPSSADRSFLASVMRAELRGRPLRGAYVLRIEGRPEIRWDKLETIQAGLSYDYWTRQR